MECRLKSKQRTDHPPFNGQEFSDTVDFHHRRMNIALPNARPTLTLAETMRNQVGGNDQVAKAKMCAYADAR